MHRLNGSFQVDNIKDKMKQDTFTIHRELLQEPVNASHTTRRLNTCTLPHVICFCSSPTVAFRAIITEVLGTSQCSLVPAKFRRLWDFVLETKMSKCIRQCQQLHRLHIFK